MAKDDYRPLDCMVVLASGDEGYRCKVTLWEVLDPKLLEARDEIDLGNLNVTQIELKGLDY